MVAIRGSIKKIEFTVSYPDGTEKVSIMENCEGVDGILFSELLMTDDMRAQFTVSNDWCDNPAMQIVRGQEIQNVCKIAQCKINK